jgi:hypothetical protein
MALHTGMGEYVYEVVENWGKLPGGWTYDIAGSASMGVIASISSTAASTR